MIEVESQATNVELYLVEVRRTNFAWVHAVEQAAVGWPDMELVDAVGEAEVVLRLFLVVESAVALSDLLADTAGWKSKAGEVEALGQLVVDRSVFSEVARRAHCSKD